MDATVTAPALPAELTMGELTNEEIEEIKALVAKLNRPQGRQPKDTDPPAGLDELLGVHRQTIWNLSKGRVGSNGRAYLLALRYIDMAHQFGGRKFWKDYHAGE